MNTQELKDVNSPPTADVVYVHHKGGRYRLIGSSEGAGGMRGVQLVIYQDIETGKIYHRRITNFNLVMKATDQQFEKPVCSGSLELHFNCRERDAVSAKDLSSQRTRFNDEMF